MSEPKRDDDTILTNMLREAEQLCRSEDALLSGQCHIYTAFESCHRYLVPLSLFSKIQLDLFQHLGPLPFPPGFRSKSCH